MLAAIEFHCARESRQQFLAASQLQRALESRQHFFGIRSPCCFFFKLVGVSDSWNANTLADSCFVCQLPLSSAAELRLLLPLSLPALRHLAWLLLLLFLRARFLSVLLFIRLSVSVSLVQCFHFFFVTI